MFVNYEALSRKERRAATKLAQQLLRTVQAAKEPHQWTSTRGALMSAFYKPKNLEGVLIYGDGEGNWWGDVLLRKGEGVIQYGTCRDSPHNSYEEALMGVKNMIASIKCDAGDHPLVQAARDIGLDPAELEILRVTHPDFGCRWMFLPDAATTVLAEWFASQFDETEMAMEIARGLLLEIGKRFVTDPYFLVSSDDLVRSDETASMLCAAAAYLVRKGIVNVDAQDISAVPFLVVDSADASSGREQFSAT